MSKREAEVANLPQEKKLKGADKKDEIAIDSELLGQQSSYGNGQATENNEVGEGGYPGTGGGDSDAQVNAEQDNDTAAAATAAVAAAAAASEPANAAAAAALNSQQHHNSQQLQQHWPYHNAFRLQHPLHVHHHVPSLHPLTQQHVGPTSQHVHHTPHLLHGGFSPLQPTTLSLVSPSSKPQHGTDEWHKQRRDNHKEVERRRRESINQGIKELALMIPTNDTNKAQILLRGVEYIKRLKENENNNIEKWTLEKLLTEQAVSELSASNEKLKQELERAYREIEQWKKLVKDQKGSA